jgi:glycerol uptake facilitator-like aquaporin
VNERDLLLPDNLAADRAQASEGPLPVPIKSMFLAETLGTFLLVQLGIAANIVNLFILYSSDDFGAESYATGAGSSTHSSRTRSSRRHSRSKNSLYFNRSLAEQFAASAATSGTENSNHLGNNPHWMHMVSSLPTKTALIWGGALAVAMLTSAALSGGHVNPSVSLSFALVRPAEFRLQSKLFPYWSAQVMGAALAAMVTLFLFHAAIAAFEEDYHLERGVEASLTSAAAFNDYYRYV